MIVNVKQLAVVLALVLVCITAIPGRAEITVSGDVDPNDPNSWDFMTLVSIGKTGDGTLNVTDGDEVSIGWSYIGYESGSTGMITVDGPGSMLMNESSVDLGYEGNGTLNITNGGMVSSTTAMIGYRSSSTGVATVDGAGSAWTNSSSLHVGYMGSGTLNIINGGAVDVQHETRVALDRESTGEIHFDNGTLTTGSL